MAHSFRPRRPAGRSSPPTRRTEGQHAQGLLTRGREILEELFPGFGADLVARGAVAIDVQRDCLWVNDGRTIPRERSGLRGLCSSRPALETYVRERVRAIGNVEIRPAHEALGLRTDDTGETVTGVRVLPRDGVEERHDADLVVDASGRGNRGPTWLAEIGHRRPPEERIDPKSVYVSRDYRRTPADADFAGLVMSASPDRPYGGIAVSAEGDRWIVTLISAGAAEPAPTDPERYPAFATRLPRPELHDLLVRAEPLGPPHRLRVPASVRRRYERLERLPEGFLAVGDALCTFNPAYAQGITVAAAQVMVLRDCLRSGRRGLPRRFFSGAARVIDVPWDIAVGADLRYPVVEAPRTRKTAFLNAYVGRMHVAAERHPVVGRSFLAVANLVTPPRGLFAPGILARVLWSGRGGG